MYSLIVTLGSTPSWSQRQHSYFHMVITNRDVKVCMLTASMNLMWDMK